jgi:predicted transcriptional regulator
MSETEATEYSRYSADDYVEILRDLGGEASTSEIAEKADREQSTVSRVLGQAVEDGEIDGVSRRDWGEGTPHIYEIDDARADDAQEGEDE